MLKLFIYHSVGKNSKLNHMIKYFLKSINLYVDIYILFHEGARIIVNNTKNLKKPGDNTIAS